MQYDANGALISTELPGIKLVNRGKVRDIYDLGDALLFIATDRLSAFDVVMPNGIPRKGEVLTQISLFWFDFLKEYCEVVYLPRTEGISTTQRKGQVIQMFSTPKVS